MSNSHIKIVLNTTPFILLYEHLSYSAPRDTKIGQEIEASNKKYV